MENRLRLFGTVETFMDDGDGRRVLTTEYGWINKADVGDWFEQ